MKRSGWVLNLVLLLATAASLFVVYFKQWGGGVASNALDDQLFGAGYFTFSVLLILGAHEMGHWAMARAHGVETSLPYFLPLPVGFGTLGAVMQLRGRVPNKNALVDIGAAGPLAGLLVAIPLLVVGILLSPVIESPIPADAFPSRMSLWAFAASVGDAARAWVDDTPALAESGAQGVVFGDNLLLVLAQRVLVGKLPLGHDLNAHPVLVAVWFGLLVTMLNLLPAGQLDGGHLVHAWFGPRAIDIGHTVASLLLLMALFFSMSWVVWFFLITRVVGFEHPPVIDEAVPLTRGRKIICTVCFISTVVVFMPVPMGLV